MSFLVPITCTFNYTIGTALEGDLFVNGKRIFGYTFESAKEKCVALRGKIISLYRPICMCGSISGDSMADFFFYSFQELRVGVTSKSLAKRGPV